MHIVIEGCKRTGKSTQVEILADRLVTAKHDVLLVYRDHEFDEITVKLREQLLDYSLSTVTRVLINCAIQAHVYETKISPFLKSGGIVIQETGAIDLVCKYGFGEGLSPSEIKHTYEWVQGGVTPDLTILLRGLPNVHYNFQETSGDVEDQFKYDMIFKSIRSDKFFLPAGNKIDHIAFDILDNLMDRFRKGNITFHGPDNLEETFKKS